MSVAARCAYSGSALAISFFRRYQFIACKLAMIALFMSAFCNESCAGISGEKQIIRQILSMEDVSKPNLQNDPNIFESISDGLFSIGDRDWNRVRSPACRYCDSFFFVFEWRREADFIGDRFLVERKSVHFQNDCWCTAKIMNGEFGYYGSAVWDANCFSADMLNNFPIEFNIYIDHWPVLVFNQELELAFSGIPQFISRPPEGEGEYSDKKRRYGIYGVMVRVEKDDILENERARILLERSAVRRPGLDLAAMLFFIAALLGAFLAIDAVKRGKL